MSEEQTVFPMDCPTTVEIPPTSDPTSPAVAPPLEKTTSSAWPIEALKWVFSFPAMLATCLIGRLFYEARNFVTDPDLFWHVRVGRDILQTHHWPTIDPYSYTVAWSPDATKIAFLDYSLSLPNHSTISALYTVNADGSGRTLLYYDPTRGSPEDPSWSPDGTKIAMGINVYAGACGIYTINADGTSLLRITAPDCLGTVERHPSWSADGQEIIFESNRNNPTGGFQIFSVNIVSYGVTLLNSSVSSVRANPDCRRCNRFNSIP